jgi:Cytochrome P460
MRVSFAAVRAAVAAVVTMKTLAVAGTAGLLVIIAAHAQTSMTAPGTAQGAGAVVDAVGNLRVPEAYRTAYQSLGSWAVAADQGRGSKELHVVYAPPGTVAAYRKDGRFPDGTVLVKEVFQAATEQKTTGTVSHAGTLKGWFVMVRGEGRYPDNQLWGDGWGWSWFDADNPTKTTSKNYKTDCLGCHVPAKGSEWIYVDGYPLLKR